MNYSVPSQETMTEVQSFYDCHAARAVYSGRLNGRKPKEIPAGLLNTDSAKIPEEVHKPSLEQLTNQ